jgi:hypothetical protein
MALFFEGVTVELRSSILYLDEAEHIYLPLIGPSQTCLRLNRPASRLWRQWTSAPVDLDALSAVERRLLDELLDKGALHVLTGPEREREAMVPAGEHANP